MKVKAYFFVLFAAAVALLILLVGCSNDEDKLTTPGPRADIIGLNFDNPVEIEINTAHHWALLLHDSSSTRGSALELVDLQHHSVTSSLILVDYSNVYDAEFINDHLAVFTGKRIPGGGYAVQFVSLPSLTLDTVLMVDTAGTHGYLAVDSAGGNVYYSHAGSGSRDAVYKISAATKSFVDADNDGHAPYGLDNGMVSGLFNGPARMVFDYGTRKLAVSNSGDDYMTVVDSSVWGHLSRTGSYIFPGLSGTDRISTVAGGIAPARASAMCGMSGYYIFAGTSGTTAFLARFGADPVGLYSVRPMPGRTWRHNSPSLRIHPRADVVSVFILQHDSTGTGIGQYGLNDFPQIAGSPHRTRSIPDSAISAFGLDVVSDQLVVGDARAARLELISIR